MKTVVTIGHISPFPHFQILYEVANEIHSPQNSTTCCNMGMWKVVSTSRLFIASTCMKESCISVQTHQVSGFGNINL